MNRFLQILLALLCSGAIYAQKISFDTNHGLPGTITGKNYVWKSPEINLGKAVNGIRITFFETEGGDLHNGYPIVALGELEVYNCNNKKITFSKISTNSLETSEGSIEALNDGKYSTFYHSKWNKGTSPDDYVYLDIAFDTSIENFSIKQVSRETNRLMGTYICITPIGVAWNKVSDVVGGTTTDGLNWSFNTLTNELKISGNGPMHDYLGNDMDSRQWLRYIKIIKKITINDGVTSVGANAFYHCSELESVNLPNSIKIIGEGAFYYCNSLENINIPKTVTRIDDRTFYHCNSLENINIPKTVTRIDDRAFYDGCVRINNLVLGSGLEKIDNCALYNCANVHNIYMMCETPPEAAGGLYSVSSHYDVTTLHVPKGTVDAYRAHELWSKFKKMEEHNLTGIGNIEDDKVSIEITANGVVVSNAAGEPLSVYDVVGKPVEKISAYSGEEILLGKGIYIISVGEKSVKIVR